MFGSELGNGAAFSTKQWRVDLDFIQAELICMRIYCVCYRVYILDEIMIKFNLYLALINEYYNVTGQFALFCLWQVHFVPLSEWNIFSYNSLNRHYRTQKIKYTFLRYSLHFLDNFISLLSKGLCWVGRRIKEIFDKVFIFASNQ